MSTRLFANGFIMTRNAPSWLPPQFVPGPRVVRNLWVDPSVDIDWARDLRGRFVVVIGICFVLDGSASAAASRGLLRAYRVSERRLLKRLDDLVGRFVVIYGRRDHQRVVADATAMRSVFYSAAGEAVGSHAELTARASQGTVTRDDLPFRYGYPGNRTPFRDIKILTANTLLDVRSSQVHRFWPRHEPVSTTVDDAARLLVESSAGAVRAAASTRPLRIAMTAGLDSRTLLATALHSGVDFELYTYGVDDKTAIDRAVAAHLAREFGLKHSVVPTAQPSPLLREQLAAANYADHHWKAVQPLQHAFGPSASAAVTANLLEIGRDFYRRPREQGLSEPTDAAAMVKLHHRSMPPAGRRMIDSYGAGRYAEIAQRAFESLLADSDWNAARPAGIGGFDQFYWEHRMSSWHGPSMNERDYYGDAFIPFNYRPLFEAMLGVPLEDRQSGEIQRRAIRFVDPRLLTVPINPSSWPTTAG